MRGGIGQIEKAAPALIVLEGSGGGHRRNIKSSGLAKEEVRKAMAGLHEIGYEAVFANSDKFDLVKI